MCLPLCGCGNLTRIEVIDGKPTDPGRESFIQPELIPPIHRHEVSEPLVCQF